MLDQQKRECYNFVINYRVQLDNKSRVKRLKQAFKCLRTAFFFFSQLSGSLGTTRFSTCVQLLLQNGGRDQWILKEYRKRWKSWPDLKEIWFIFKISFGSFCLGLTQSPMCGAWNYAPLCRGIIALNRTVFSLSEIVLVWLIKRTF